MELKTLIQRTRTVRRFQEKETPPGKVWEEILEVLKLGGSARNLQVLKYMLVCNEELRQKIFPLLGWAGYLEQWPGPASGERPAAYLICLLDTSLSIGTEREAYCDLGIATQNFLLAASAQAIYGCRIASFSEEKIHNLLQLESHLKPILIIALGYRAEETVLESVGSDGNIRDWRDNNGVHHIPKRSLTEIMVSEPASSF
ncbi:MAG: nitroreductase family protein [Desulfobulbaceae bacterium]|nr:nitroreductase family protein [Desulfobulbaceae bacterium]